MSEPTCDCLTCAFRAVLERRYPHGLDLDGRAEVLATLADVSGVALASSGPAVFAYFLARVEARRRGVCVPVSASSGAVH